MGVLSNTFLMDADLKAALQHRPDGRSSMQRMLDDEAERVRKTLIPELLVKKPQTVKPA